MSALLWQECLQQLEEESSQQDFNQLISPLQAELSDKELILWAPNQYVLDGVTEVFLKQIVDFFNKKTGGEPPSIVLCVGSKAQEEQEDKLSNENKHAQYSNTSKQYTNELKKTYKDNLNPQFTFDTFVVGKSNQLAEAAAKQVSENAGAYNPLMLYGGVGLGKTHLMQAIGNALVKKESAVNPGQRAKVLYLHSEKFVADMVKALQRNAINEFKNYYRSVDALLIDDIQFFSGKDRSQEEFFHTFNALLEGQRQVILTSDRYPREIYGIEERLKSRFGSGLTVAVNPPELETRVAILMNKAELLGVELNSDVAFFIARKVRSNVRELEGALKRVVANSQFMGKEITVEFTREALKDMIAVQNKVVSVDNILKIVADYYKIKVAELLSKKRVRVIARPRQVAMSLCKELTACSYPEIGEFFGGKDHTTVMHACKTIERLKEEDNEIKKDFFTLIRIISD